MVDHEHNKFLPPQLLQLVSRHDPELKPKQLERLDGLIKQVHLNEKTVIMYEFELDEVEK
jgi:hypothetical protein